MKNMKKAVVLMLCVGAIAASSIFGTMAYLTSRDTVTNTFTVGNVYIDLDEAKVNPEGDPVDANGKVLDDVAEAPRVTENEYHLLPGHTYEKDPTVTVKAGSEDAYVRVLVTVSDIADVDDIFAKYANVTEFTLENIVSGLDKTKWVPEDAATDDTTANTRTFELRYYETVNAKNGADVVLTDVFTQLVMPGVLTNEDLKLLNDFEITVVAHAIQADGFTSADNAWSNFDETTASVYVKPADVTP